MTSQNSSYRISSKKQSKITDAYEFEDFDILDDVINDVVINQNNEVSTPIDINKDNEWSEYYTNNDEEEDNFDLSLYDKLETQGVTDCDNVFHDECNFHDVVEMDSNDISPEEFVCGVSTNENMKNKNYLTDLVSSSGLHIRKPQMKFTKQLYNEHHELGLFYCFIRQHFLKDIFDWTNTNLIYNFKNILQCMYLFLSLD